MRGLRAFGARVPAVGVAIATLARAMATWPRAVVALLRAVVTWPRAVAASLRAVVAWPRAVAASLRAVVASPWAVAISPRAMGLQGVAMATLLAGCAQPPPPPPAAPPAPPRSYVVLLENADGSTGKVIVSGAQGTVQLERARQAAPLDGAQARVFAPDEKQIAADFGAALAAQPRAPRTFLLYFELGGTQLTPASQAQVSEILDEVRARPAADLSIVGHTDTMGTAQANETLALNRAEFVNRLLRPAAAGGAQVEVTSHGERNLLVQTPDETPEPRNRRVEVTVR